MSTLPSTGSITYLPSIALNTIVSASFTSTSLSSAVSFSVRLMVITSPFVIASAASLSALAISTTASTVFVSPVAFSVPNTLNKPTPATITSIIIKVSTKVHFFFICLFSFPYL